MKSSFGIGSIKGSLPGREPGGPYAATPSMRSIGTMGGTMGSTLGTFTVGGGGGTMGSSRSITVNNASRGIPTAVGAASPLGASAATMGQSTAKPDGFDDEAIANIENRFPEKPTLEQKQRLVFAEFDVKNERTLTFEGFRRVLRALNIEFTEPTVEDMYERADLNKNGRMNYSEYLDWAGHYPNLVDAIYSRARAMVERSRREKLVDAQKYKLEQAQKKEREQQDVYDTAKRDLEIALRDIAGAQEEHFNRINIEKMRQDDLFEATRAMENAKVARNAAEMEWQAMKGREREVLKPLLEIRGGISTCQNRIQTNDAVLEQLQDRVRQFEKSINDLKKDITKLNDDNIATEGEIERLQGEEQELVQGAEEAALVTKNLQAEFKAAEGAARKAIEEQAKALAAQKKALDDARQAGKVHEQLERNVAPLRVREQTQLGVHQNAIRAVDDADAELRSRDLDLANLTAFHAASDADEHALLEHEVRLREQRFNLDDRDDVLHDETTRFVNTVGRHDTRLASPRRL